VSITYKTDIRPNLEDIIALYDDAGLVRPTKDKARIRQMYQNSNLVITAWSEESQLIGIARCLTDYCYVCYLSDLAVKKEYQKAGIGKKLIETVKEKIGEKTSLILLSAPEAMEYYPKVGFEKITNGFIIKRKN